MSPFREIERRRKRAKSSYTDLKKHYVRLEGWLPVFQGYARQQNRSVRYLTLCAKYAIDVRYFRSKGVLQYDATQKIYPTVAFVEKDAQDFAIIAETLGTTKLGIKGDLEEILVRPEEHPANSEKLRKSFPYDIINLDFTGEVTREDDPPYSGTIRAIERIIEFQNAANCQVWHMFLTFRACPQTSNHEADEELRVIVEDNLQNAGAQAAYGSRSTPEELVRIQYEEFLRIGIAKFLASSASHRGYASFLQSSYIYPRTPGRGEPAYHIVKLIVEFRAIRAARNLPNPRRAMDAYENSVPQIFRSQPVDVYAQLGDPATRRRIEDDLRPVLDELEQQHIID
jgi:hypothetical protein